MFVELGYSWKNLGEYGREKFTHEEIVGEALDLPGEPQHSLVDESNEMVVDSYGVETCWLLVTPEGVTIL